MIEVNTLIKFEDKEDVNKKSFFEIKFSTIVNIIGDVKEKSELEKILLCDVQEDILPDIEKSFRFTTQLRILVLHLRKSLILKNSINKERIRNNFFKLFFKYFYALIIHHLKVL